MDVALFRAELEHHPGIMLLVEPPSGRIHACSDAACTFYGYSREVMLQKSIFDFNTMPREEVISRMEGVATGRESTLRFIHRLASGRILEVEVHSGIVQHEDPVLLLSVINDVSAAAEDRRRNEFFFAQTPEPMVIFDSVGKILAGNGAFSRVIGFGEKEFVGRSGAEFLDTGDKARFLRELGSLREHVGQPRFFELGLRDREGQYRTLSWSAGYHLRSGLIYATARDVTEVRRAQRELDEHQLKLQHAQDVAGLGYWELEVGSEEAAWSSNLFEMFQITPRPGGLVPLSQFFAAIHPEDRQRVRDSLVPIPEGLTIWEWDFRIVWPTGEIRNIQSRARVYPAESGRPRRLIGVALDFTSFHRAQEMLLEQERQFRAVADFGYDWEAWTSPEGVLLWVNPAVERITGYTAEDCLAMPNYPLGMVFPEDIELVRGIMHSSARGEPGNHVRFRVQTKTGDTRWVAASWQPIQIEGEPFGTRSSIRDVHETVLREMERDAILAEVRQKSEQIRTLKGLLPICASCKSIRDDEGYWQQIETYMGDHADVEFSHGICPNCMRKLYPELSDEDEGSVGKSGE